MRGPAGVAAAAAGALCFVVVVARWQTLPHQTVDLASAAAAAADTPWFPIDGVFTWVDSSDPQWRASRSAYAAARGVAFDAARYPHPRFVDVELRRSLSLAAAHMPWLRTIYVVVARPQRCAWWSDFPRVRAVYHDELLAAAAPPSAALPTFNSYAIETFVHLIPGLSEHFVYFNDDTYVLRPVPRTDFFGADGRFHSMVDTAVAVPYPQPYFVAEANLSVHLGYQIRFHRLHTPLAITKTAISTTISRWPLWAAQTRASRFRSFGDLPLYQAAVNLNARRVLRPPPYAYIECGSVSAHALANLTYACVNNCASASDYARLLAALV